MSRTRLDVVLVALVVLVSVGLGAYLVLRTDPSPSRFEVATCDGERGVRNAIDADAPFASVQQAIRSMAHTAGRVEEDTLRIHAARARTHMHRVHRQAVLAGATTVDALPARAAAAVGPGARREWARVRQSLRVIRVECHRLGVNRERGRS